MSGLSISGSTLSTEAAALVKDIGAVVERSESLIPRINLPVGNITAIARGEVAGVSDGSYADQLESDIIALAAQVDTLKSRIATLPNKGEIEQIGAMFAKKGLDAGLAQHRKFSHVTRVALDVAQRTIRERQVRDATHASMMMPPPPFSSFSSSSVAAASMDPMQDAFNSFVRANRVQISRATRFNEYTGTTSENKEISPEERVAIVEALKGFIRELTASGDARLNQIYGFVWNRLHERFPDMGMGFGKHHLENVTDIGVVVDAFYAILNGENPPGAENRIDHLVRQVQGFVMDADGGEIDANQLSQELDLFDIPENRELAETLFETIARLHDQSGPKEAMVRFGREHRLDNVNILQKAANEVFYSLHFSSEEPFSTAAAPGGVSSRAFGSCVSVLNRMVDSGKYSLGSKELSGVDRKSAKEAIAAFVAAIRGTEEEAKLGQIHGIIWGKLHATHPDAAPGKPRHLGMGYGNHHLMNATDIGAIVDALYQVFGDEEPRTEKGLLEGLNQEIRRFEEEGVSIGDELDMFAEQGGNLEAIYRAMAEVAGRPNDDDAVVFGVTNREDIDAVQRAIALLISRM